MKNVYPTFIAQNGKDFLVYVPDMDIYTEGTDFANAIEMARDAIGLKGIDYEDDGKPLPVPSTSGDAILKAKEDTEIFDYSQGILTFVDIDFAEYRKKVDTKTVRRNVALPNLLTTRLTKQAAMSQGFCRKRLLKPLIYQDLYNSSLTGWKSTFSLPANFP